MSEEVQDAEIVMHDGVQIRVECPFCEQYHYHGIGKAGKLDGAYRDSHCLQGTYKLKITEKTKKVKKLRIVYKKMSVNVKRMNNE